MMFSIFSAPQICANEFKVGFAELSITPELIDKWEDTNNDAQSDPESVRIAQQLDPVVTVNIKVKMDDEDSKITLCYPYDWIQNILASPAAKNKVISTEKSSSDDEKATMSENLQLVKVPMKAKLGTAKLSFKNIIELEEGDLVILDNKTHEEIDIEMIDKLLYTASIGVSNGKYACKINNVIIGGK